jgi:hypothetical protein
MRVRSKSGFASQDEIEQKRLKMQMERKSSKQGAPQLTDDIFASNAPDLMNINGSRNNSNYDISSHDLIN